MRGPSASELGQKLRRGKADPVELLEDVFARIDSVGPLIKGLPAPTIEGEAILYDGDEEGSPVWDKLRPWMHETIRKAKAPGKADDLPEQRNYSPGDQGYIAAADDLDDDVPF